MKLHVLRVGGYLDVRKDGFPFTIALQTFYHGDTESTEKIV